MTDLIPRAEAVRMVREAVAQARSDAINEFCKLAGIRPLTQVHGLPDDVRIWRMNKAVEACAVKCFDRAAAIRAGEKP